MLKIADLNSFYVGAIFGLIVGMGWIIILDVWAMKKLGINIKDQFIPFKPLWHKYKIVKKEDAL